MYTGIQSYSHTHTFQQRKKSHHNLPKINFLKERRILESLYHREDREEAHVSHQRKFNKVPIFLEQIGSYQVFLNALELTV